MERKDPSSSPPCRSLEKMSLVVVLKLPFEWSWSGLQEVKRDQAWPVKEINEVSPMEVLLFSK